VKTNTGFPAGTGGVGAEIVVELAKHHPERIIFTGRNAKSADSTIKRAQAAAPGINISFVTCDLASLDSVQVAADKILAETPRLDLFLPNAGIMAKPAGLSTDGFEIHFATNHLGHALLTEKLLPLLEKTAMMPGADVRIIYTLTSCVPRRNPPSWGAGFATAIVN
jgi:NAD(P)-dependent dehydrogenase (short-subunit alcohol dehydrogenase family)